MVIKSFPPMMMLATMLLINLFYPFNRLSNMLGNTSVQNSTREWTKAELARWPGKRNGKLYWYKIDQGKVWLSTDGKAWKPVPDGIWCDRTGKLYKIKNNGVMWNTSSTNRAWTYVNGWTWQASDGQWYKLDQDWKLWVRANK